MEDSIRHSMQALFVVLAVVGLALFLSRKYRRNPLAALLLTGFVIGLIRPLDLNLELLAGFGILALFFEAGIKLSVGLLRSMWRELIIGGLTQVLLTVAITAGCCLVMGSDWRFAVFVGFLVAMSSTALAIRYFETRGELSTPQGRVALGIFLQQDLWLLPLSPLIPLLAPKALQSDTGLLPLAFGVGVLGGFFLLSRWVVNPLLDATARLRSPEASIMVTVGLCIGSALITSYVGLSVALGGFLAGLMISSNDNRHESHAAIKPFTHVFGAFFFVSIGTLVDLKVCYANWLIILVAVVGVVVVKFVTGFIAARVLGYTQRVSVIVAASLSHIGELSVVLATVGVGVGLLQGEEYHIFVAVAVLSMMLMPLLMYLANRFESQIPEIRFISKRRASAASHQSVEAGKSTEQVVVIGYGPVGHFQAVLLQRNKIPFVVLEMNPGTIRRLKRDNMPYIIGDCSRREILAQVGITSARLIVIAISDYRAIERTIALIREEAPTVPIIVRTRYWSHATQLAKIKAVTVITEDVSTGMAMHRELARRLELPLPANAELEDLIAAVSASFGR